MPRLNLTAQPGATNAMLGCVVVRRISDDNGRGWRVREFRTASGVALFFRCDIPGVRPEARAVTAPLESLSDDELVEALRLPDE